MAAAPAALTLAATGFKVAGDLAGAKQQAAGDAFQAQELEKEAQSGQIKANQTSQQLTSTLQRQVGNVQAVRASANTDPNSPTGQAVVDRVQALGDNRTQIAVLNIDQQVQQDTLASKFYESAARASIMNGYLGAGGDILTAMSPMFKQGGAFNSPQSPLSIIPQG
jgi:hypothetical protein